MLVIDMEDALLLDAVGTISEVSSKQTSSLSAGSVISSKEQGRDSRTDFRMEPVNEVLSGVEVSTESNDEVSESLTVTIESVGNGLFWVDWADSGRVSRSTPEAMSVMSAIPTSGLAISISVEIF